VNVLARLRTSGRRFAVHGSGALICAAVLGSAVPGGAAQAQAATGGAHAAAAHHGPGAIHLTRAQAAAWQHATATVAGRERIVSAFRTAFSGTAEVGTGPRIYQTAPITANRPLRPDLAYGITGDHFWIIVSYADVIDHAIDAGISACRKRVPVIRFVCTAAGNWLKSQASGWGGASNHGVWAALYWLPPHFTGGRW
jgi:hypothetical protein